MIQSLEPFLAVGGNVSKGDLDPNAVERIGGQIHGIAWFNQAKEFWYHANMVADAGLTSPKELEAREGDAGANFVRETAATRVSSGSMVRALKQAAASKTDPFDIEMTLLPKGPGGQRATVHSINANYISTSSLEPDATWEFYKFLIGPNSDSFIADLGGRRYTAIRGQVPIVQYDYEDAAVYAAMTALSVPTKRIIKQSEVDGAWRENWGAFEEGSKTVREVQEEMQALAEIAIEDGCIC